jgi:hypothetical protein
MTHPGVRTHSSFLPLCVLCVFAPLRDELGIDCTAGTGEVFLLFDSYQLPRCSAENFLLVHTLGEGGRGRVYAGHYRAETEFDLLHARIEKVPVETGLVVHQETYRLRLIITPIVFVIRFLFWRRRYGGTGDKDGVYNFSA